MAFLAIAALSSCSQEEEFLSGSDNNSYGENAVTFGTYLGQAPLSRAVSTDTEGLKSLGFGVFAYYTEEADFAEGKFTPDFMRNEKVYWAKEKGWTYSPVKYWPNIDGHKVSFFAYAPYTEIADTTNITSLPAMGEKDDEGKVTTPSDPVIGFKMEKKYKKQFDLLYSDPALTANMEKQSIDEKVQFIFKHALSRVGFKAMVMIDEVPDKENGSASGDGSNHKDNFLGEKTTVTIDSITFESDDFSISGELNLATGEWNIKETGNMSYTFDDKDFIAGSNIFEGGESTAAAAAEGADEGTTENNSRVVKLLDEYLMLMPSPIIDKKHKMANVKLTVVYTVETEDAKLVGGKTGFKHKMTVPFKFEFIQGEAYDFVIHIGLTSVKLNAEVSDWDNTTGEAGTNRTVYESNNYLGTFDMYPDPDMPGLTVSNKDVYKAKVMFQENDTKVMYTIPEFKGLTGYHYGSVCELAGWSKERHDVITDGILPSNLLHSGQTVEIPLEEGLDNFKLYGVWYVSTVD